MLLLAAVSPLLSQSRDVVKKMFDEGRFEESKPIFEKLLAKNPKNSEYNYWYAACCLETADTVDVEEMLEFAASRNIVKAHWYLGYWYFIHGIEMDTLLADCQNEVVLDVENRGFAHAYHPFTLKLALIDEAGKARVINPDSPDLRTWEGESRLRVPLSLCLDGVPVGEYTLAVGIFDEKMPILLGLKESLRTSEGFYALQKVTVASL